MGRRERQALWSIGAGERQLARIRAAHAAGFAVVATDLDPEAPGLREAEVPLALSRDDAAGMAARARALQAAGELDLVAVYAGNSVSWDAQRAVEQALGLPRTPAELDKRDQGRRLRAAGLRTPECLAAKEGLWVVKPVVGQGSVGVRIVRAPARPLVRSERWIAQPLVRGRHLDVNGFFDRLGGYQRGGISERTPREDVPWIFESAEYPARLETGLRDRLHELLCEAGRALGYVRGPLKADVILQGDDAYILEVEPRFHGDVITFGLHAACGDDVFVRWLRDCAAARRARQRMRMVFQYDPSGPADNRSLRAVFYERQGGEGAATAGPHSPPS